MERDPTAADHIHSEAVEGGWPARELWWRLPLLLALVLGVIVLSRSCELRTQPKQHPEELNGPSDDTSLQQQEPGRTVRLIIDFGKDNRREATACWYDGMTVADLLRSVDGLSIEQRGSESGAFLDAIGNMRNEGADGRNWTYEVNGEVADRSFEIYKLEPEDRVLWKFGP